MLFFWGLLWLLGVLAATWIILWIVTLNESWGEELTSGFRYVGLIEWLRYH